MDESPIQFDMPSNGTVSKTGKKTVKIRTTGNEKNRQPLDVCLNKPFKDRMRQKWLEWMAEGIHELTAGGHQKKPSEELMCQWICEALHDIPGKMAAKSFLMCGITNSLDGSKMILYLIPPQMINRAWLITHS